MQVDVEGRKGDACAFTEEIVTLEFLGWRLRGLADFQRQDEAAAIAEVDDQEMEARDVPDGRGARVVIVESGAQEGGIDFRRPW